MSSQHYEALQALWEELNQSEAERQQKELEGRLKQRAKLYAAPEHEGDSAHEDAYYVLSFTLGRERYAIDVELVRGVRPCGRITRVPAIPDFYRGVVNVRGQIISVLDLRRFFNLEVSDKHAPREMIMVSANGLELALLADHIEEVLTIPYLAVEPLEMPYTRGVTMGRLALLDLQRLFEDERLTVK